MKSIKIVLTLSFCFLFFKGICDPIIYVNQVAYDSKAPKKAVIGLDNGIGEIKFYLMDEQGKTVFTGNLTKPLQVAAWDNNRYFQTADFSAFDKAGKYTLVVKQNGTAYKSAPFSIGVNALISQTLPSILHYYRKQRANTPQELAADQHMLLYGSNKTVDIRGGWADASGDISKYFSHLAYANFMSPQQIPMVTWAMVNAREAIPNLLTKLGVKDSIESEALWGADYIMRSLSSDNYFYMTVFSYFKPDASARRIVGLEANSVTTSAYQCAFREGGGMGIAALARISGWHKNADFTSAQYLNAAERAFAHLLINNTIYDDDGKENIIDDYCALMAATELWMVTDKVLYRDEARKRAEHLVHRMSPAGYFIADDQDRPFWHASDAGLPVIALARYLKKENDPALRTTVLGVIKKALDYNLRVTNEVSNPFGYARQTFKYKGAIKDGFFIPHENETGWWWQGENARLGSLAAAALVGGKLVYPQATGWKVKDALANYAAQQVSWVLGCNPYAMCFMYGFGKSNVPYMKALFGHGSERGGISNGITGKDGNGDGSGIDFKTKAQGNEWRWTEQWIPHAGWFLQALTAMAE